MTSSLSKTELLLFQEKAREIRIKTVQIVTRAKSCHIGSALSCIDIIAALYFKVLRINPKDPKNEERDRFIMSKGHACSCLYVTLALRGFFQEEYLHTNYLKDGSFFTAHANAEVPGVEVSTGSLGHGLSIGLGMAFAAKQKEAKYNVFVLLSDGECDEGSTWEAILAASHFNLHNLIAIVDYNKIQSFGRVKEVMNLEPFSEKWRAFGWNVQEVNGHDIEQVCAALLQATQHTQQQKPTVIIAHTIKGKGVSFMEDTIECHYLTPTEEQAQIAINELKGIK